MNSYPLDPGLLPHPSVGRRGVFLRGGRELRQRCARKRCSLIEFACGSLTEEMKTHKLSIKSMVKYHIQRTLSACHPRQPRVFPWA